MLRRVRYGASHAVGTNENGRSKRRVYRWIAVDNDRFVGVAAIFLCLERCRYRFSTRWYARRFSTKCRSIPKSLFGSFSGLCKFLLWFKESVPKERSRVYDSKNSNTVQNAKKPTQRAQLRFTGTNSQRAFAPSRKQIDLGDSQSEEDGTGMG